MVQQHVNLDPDATVGSAPPVELRPVDDSVPIRLRTARSPFLTTGNLMLLAMFAAGIVGLYVLSRRNGPSSALAAQNLAHAKVEAALDVLGAAPTEAEVERQSGARAMVNEFYTAARQRQVDKRDLRGNPFVFRGVRPAAPKPVQPKKPAEPVNKVPEELRQAMAAVEGLRLQSILCGNQTTALISSNLVTVGQTIRGWTVTRISPRQVELTWKDKKHVLEISN